MATVVQRFSEGAYIITADGEEIPIYEGMVLEDGDIIVGDVATIEDANAVDPGDDPTRMTAEDIAAIQEQILQGADPTQVAEGPAAGGDRAFADPGPAGQGGHSFTSLDRTGGEVDPTAGYPTGTFTSAFETPQEEPPAVLDEVPPSDPPVTPEPPVTPPEPQDPVVTTIIETKTEVRTEVDVRILDGAEVETSRTTDVNVEEVTSDRGQLITKTTTTTTTITYNQETDTITTTVTTTETFERDVTTTTYPDGTVTVERSDWVSTGTTTDTDESTDTVETPRTEVLEDVVVEETVVEPVVTVVTETREVVDVDTDTQTNVGVEYEVNRTTDTVVAEEETEDGTLKTTTTTTTINYNQETDTITTTVTTTVTEARTITTTTYPDGSEDVVTGEWIETNRNVVTEETTDTVETPRQEILTNVVEDLEPYPEAEPALWFIAQGGNHPGEDDPTGVDYHLLTEESGRYKNDMDLVISNKQMGNYKVSENDTVTFKFNTVMTDAIYNLDYTLSIASKAPQWDIDSWDMTDNVLTVTIAYNGTGEFNLAGNTFAINVESITNGYYTVGFDMDTVTHYDSSEDKNIEFGTWESNDDVVMSLSGTVDHNPELTDEPIIVLRSLVAEEQITLPEFLEEEMEVLNETVHIDIDFNDVLSNFDDDVLPINPMYLDEENNDNLALTADAGLYVTFIHEGAGFQNTFGYFTFDDDHNILEEHIIFENVSYEDVPGGNLKTGDTKYLGEFEAGTNIGFFVIADGYLRPENTKWYSLAEKNPDGKDHVVLMNDSVNNKFVIGFEDLWYLGDNDFDDVVFTLHATPYGAVNTDYIPPVLEQFVANEVIENDPNLLDQLLGNDNTH